MTKVTEVTELPEFPAPRIVRPRKTGANWLPILVLTHEWAYTETEGPLPLWELPNYLRHAPSSLVVAQDFGFHFGNIVKRFEGDDTFTYRVTPIARYHRDNRHKSICVDAICNYFGWRILKADGRTRRTHYHYPLDPIWFLSSNINEIDDNPDKSIMQKLTDWATQLRQWAYDNELKVTPSAGGIAAQLLKDSRFYPEPRRKVPKVINRMARPYLPGNYYELRCKPGIPRNAIMLDMENAHHALAKRIKFPDANTLHAFGTTDSNTGQPWSNNREILNRPGLFRLQVTIPHIPDEQFPPPALKNPSNNILTVYSNELQWLQSFGVKIEGIWWAITSNQSEPGLNKYAEWAIREIRKNPTSKTWLKPTLHSVYGLLATRAQPFETGFRGNGWDYPMGSNSIPVKRVRIDREIESSIVNVIHRGMIEAEVRKECLFYARLLNEVDHHRILAIYADAILVEDTGKEIRLLEAPWRIKETVKHITFENATTFTSPTISRLPGVPRDSRERFIRQREISDHIRAARADREIAPIWQP